MTAFDAIALALLGVSALIGFTRGAVRELVGLFALTLSGLGSLALLPMASPLARRLIHPPWLASVIIAVLLFAAVFIVLQLLAGLITASLDKRRLLGGANRGAGLAFGVVRGLVLLGLFALVFARVTPLGLQPPWITGAAVYPMARASGRVLQTVLPQGLRLVNRADGASPAPPPPDEADPGRGAPLDEDGAFGTKRGAKSTDHGYTVRARDRLDALVEQSK